MNRHGSCYARISVAINEINRKISRESDFKTDKFCYCYDTVYFSDLRHQTVGHLTFRHFGRTKQTAHRAINLTTLGSFSKKRCN